MSETNVLTISVFNSDAGRKFNLHIRDDRYRAWLDFLNRNRQPDAKPGMPGLSWAAIQGLDAIFEKRPRSFPTRDILSFLAGDYHPHSSCPAVTPAEIELVLEQFSKVYPPDVSENA